MERGLQQIYYMFLNGWEFIKYTFPGAHMVNMLES